jgi:probable selenium-dependent hydroxylase accessory protein YqeC
VKVELTTSLTEALGVTPGSLVGIVGAGGKTSLMYGLGREIAARGLPVVLTTTTKIIYPGVDDARSAGARVVVCEEGPDAAGLVRAALAESRLVIAGRARIDPKLHGFSPAFLDGLARELAPATVVAECDGARGRSLKVPRQDEPQVPSSAGLYVIVVGADCLGKSVTSDEVFNPEAVEALCGVGPEAAVRQVVVKCVVSPDSYLGRKPPGARCVVFINKIGVGGFGETDGDRDKGRMTSALETGLDLKCAGGIERVVSGSLGQGLDRGFLVLT